MLAKSIAVIEDEIDVLNLYQDVLENEGYTVFAYNEPIEAINNIQQMPHLTFDIYLLDTQSINFQN